MKSDDNAREEWVLYDPESMCMRGVDGVGWIGWQRMFFTTLTRERAEDIRAAHYAHTHLDIIHESEARAIVAANKARRALDVP